jgi:RNA polymerase sigma factor (sigma-70 family)
MNSASSSEAFVCMIETHKGILYKITNAYCQDIEDRKDLVQEIIVQLWRSFDKYDDAYKRTTWIYRIALNVAISFYRKEKTRRAHTEPYSPSIFNLADEGLDIDRATQLGQLSHFVAELMELDKAVMLLYLEEKSYKEIAEIIGITETNVATKIGRIKASLRQKFERIQNQS